METHKARLQAETMRALGIAMTPRTGGSGGATTTSSGAPLPPVMAPRPMAMPNPGAPGALSAPAGVRL
mgnify:CR=1 FL=1